jgi:hypothetical protein
MFVNRDNYEDIKKYYQGCFVKFKETGEHIWHIDHVDPDKIVCSDSKKEEVAIDLDIGYEMDYILPKKTVFQFGDHAMMLSRIPARQWKKGMSKLNTKFVRLTGAGSWGMVDFSISYIEGFTNKPSYYDAQDSLKEFANLNSALGSAAITPRISMCRDGKVFIDTVLVGKFDLNEKTFICKKIFQPELAHYFKDFKAKYL